MTQGYTEQYDRMLRYLGRFEKINNGITHDRSSQNYDDDVYAFFQNCYHFKDWIKNDPECSSWSNVEELINENPHLKICADLCNALKHFTLSRPRSNESPNFAGGHIHLNIGADEKTTLSVKYKVSTTSGNIDAFELANTCVLAWKAYIEQNGNQLE